MSERVQCVGVDDGFSQTCICTDSLETLIIPSSARSGKNKKVSLSFTSGEDEDMEYEIKKDDEESSFFTFTKDGEPTHSNAYPFSELNRSIVHHALHSAGLSGASLRVCSGLPVSMFYNGFEPNESNKTKKVHNLLNRKVHPSKKDDSSDITIVEHVVIPEGIASWFDYIITSNGKVRRGIDPAAPIAFVDIGGNTTDVAVIKDSRIDLSRSGSIRAGVIHVRELLKIEILRAFDLDDIPADEMGRAIRTGGCKIYGKQEDVSSFLADSVSDVSGQIKRDLEIKLGKGSDLDKVVFVGGGSLLFSDVVGSKMFRNGSISSNPELSNARGMMKYIKYAHQG